MIFYFSGTGNSQLVAKQIAETTGNQMISINQCLKEGENHTFYSEEPLVFVMPTYAWRMPKVVEQWIRGARFEGNFNAYFVFTCAGGCGNAGTYAKKLCAEKGMLFYGIASVIMPENYLAMFVTPNRLECQNILEKAMPRIMEIAIRIQMGDPFSEKDISLRNKLESGPIHWFFYLCFVHDKGFTVSNDCISCGKCSKRCSLNNIKMVSGKPVWKGNCTHCMACIAGCSTESIEYKSASKGKHRHYIIEESLI